MSQSKIESAIHPSFLYRDEDERQAEFHEAEAYFSAHPTEFKLSRFESETGSYPFKHSYLKFEDGTILAIASNKTTEYYYQTEQQRQLNQIGRGSFGRVKYAMDKTGMLYALKIERKNNPDQILEAKISADVDLLRFEKKERNLGSSNKYYSVMSFGGSDLCKILYESDTSPDLKERLLLGRKAAWQLHLLHQGALSKTGKKYAHGDVKLDNIVQDSQGRVRLVDYGSAEELLEEHDPRCALSSFSESEINRLIDILGQDGSSDRAKEIKQTLVDAGHRANQVAFSKDEIEIMRQHLLASSIDDDSNEEDSKLYIKAGLRRKGTPAYLPLTAKEIDIDRRRGTHLDIDTRLSSRITEMGYVKVDTFALKRVFGELFYDEIQSSSLNTNFGSLINTAVSEQKMETLVKRDDTPLDLAYACIQQQKQYYPTTPISAEEKQAICACFEGLDEMNVKESSLAYDWILKTPSIALRVLSVLQDLVGKPEEERSRYQHQLSTMSNDADLVRIEASLMPTAEAVVAAIEGTTIDICKDVKGRLSGAKTGDSESSEASTSLSSPHRFVS